MYIFIEEHTLLKRQLKVQSFLVRLADHNIKGTRLLYIFSLVHFSVFKSYLCTSAACRPSEGSTRYCAIPGGNKLRDWQSFALGLGGARIEPGVSTYIPTSWCGLQHPLNTTKMLGNFQQALLTVYIYYSWKPYTWNAGNSQQIEFIACIRIRMEILAGFESAVHECESWSLIRLDNFFFTDCTISGYH